jgi:quercetin dioxygenase-like cupin family protein
MERTSLIEIADRTLADARAASANRAAVTLFGGHEHALRQTVIALLAGNGLAEHESPGEATLQVLSGRVRLSSGDNSWTGSAGDIVGIPPARHDLAALDDSVVLLTVVKPR